MKNKYVLLFFTLVCVLSLISLGFAIYEISQIGKVHVAYIEINGPITYDSELDIDKLISVLKQVNSSEEISAIILKINSPGGSAVPVYRIVSTLDKINKIKVAYIDEIGASGAYWVACATDYIIAHPYSEVGSIGAIYSYFQISELLKKLGIKYIYIKEGKYKDLASPFRNLTPEEEKIIREQIEILYNDFVNYVKSKRQVDPEVFESSIYLGKVAKEKGLVDEIGDFELVKEYLAKKFNVSKSDIIFIKYDVYKEKSWIKEALGLMMEKVVSKVLYEKPIFQLTL